MKVEKDGHSAARGHEKTPTRIGPRFLLIYGTVVGLTVLALILTVVLALLGADSDVARAATEACSTTYKLGFGAIVGLLADRAH